VISALGHVRILELSNVMSALPQKRTLAVGVPRTPRATSELSNLLFARAYWGTILF
jgi:hypothetical protein